MTLDNELDVRALVAATWLALLQSQRVPDAELVDLLTVAHERALKLKRALDGTA